MSQKTYELYVLDGCPYCAKVLSYMDEHDVKLPVRSITGDAEARAYLEEKGGKVQCPCLFIDGQPLYESDDIVNYLKEHLVA